MSAKILSGKEVAASIKDECKAAAEELRAKGIVPKLGILRVGAKDNDLAYERGVLKRFGTIDVAVEVTELDGHRISKIKVIIHEQHVDESGKA